MSTGDHPGDVVIDGAFVVEVVLPFDGTCVGSVPGDVDGTIFLPVSPGDLLQVLCKHQGGWWVAREMLPCPQSGSTRVTQPKRMGLVPASFVRELKREEAQKKIYQLAQARAPCDQRGNASRETSSSAHESAPKSASMSGSSSISSSGTVDDVEVKDIDGGGGAQRHPANWCSEAQGRQASSQSHESSVGTCGSRVGESQPDRTVMATASTVDGLLVIDEAVVLAPHAHVGLSALHRQRLLLEYEVSVMEDVLSQLQARCADMHAAQAEAHQRRVEESQKLFGEWLAAEDTAALLSFQVSDAAKRRKWLTGGPLMREVDVTDVTPSSAPGGPQAEQWKQELEPVLINVKQWKAAHVARRDGLLDDLADNCGECAAGWIFLERQKMTTLPRDGATAEALPCVDGVQRVLSRLRASTDEMKKVIGKLCQDVASQREELAILQLQKDDVAAEEQRTAAVEGALAAVAPELVRHVRSVTTGSRWAATECDEVMPSAACGPDWPEMLPGLTEVESSAVRHLVDETRAIRAECSRLVESMGERVGPATATHIDPAAPPSAHTARPPPPASGVCERRVQLKEAVRKLQQRLREGDAAAEQLRGQIERMRAHITRYSATADGILRHEEQLRRKIDQLVQSREPLPPGC